MKQEILSSKYLIDTGYRGGEGISEVRGIMTQKIQDEMECMPFKVPKKESHRTHVKSLCTSQISLTHQ